MSRIFLASSKDTTEDGAICASPRGHHETDGQSVGCRSHTTPTPRQFCYPKLPPLLKQLIVHSIIQYANKNGSRARSHPSFCPAADRTAFLCSLLYKYCHRLRCRPQMCGMPLATIIPSVPALVS